MSVAHGNRWARAYVTAQTATVTVTDDTKVRGNGAKEAADLAVTDRVLVQARVCKAELLAVGPLPVSQQCAWSHTRRARRRTTSKFPLVSVHGGSSE